ncbi:tyrosine-type recombinase/integrase [Cupriavidus sp. WS]|uniref:tyrosine-type recombinase/integrase n=1 Tax=Cupriavidus sp. WS TaxID=1312922 RepID=UPI0009DB834D|nr:tyrosine-type recombinase/integrase [Cupriavidus sp. WS]
MENDSDRLGLKSVTIGARRYFVAYSPEDDVLIWPLMDYAIFLSDRLLLDEKSVEKTIRSVASFINYMWGEYRARVSRKYPTPQFLIEQAYDSVLERYRNNELRLVMQKPNSSGDEILARKTVNAKLVEIYYFLAWYQHTTGCKGLIGSRECRVTSELKHATSRRGMRTSTSSSRVMFPKLYKRTGKNSTKRHGYAATDSDVAKLSEYIKHEFTAFAAVRNNLMLTIADEMGWRCESIVSLRCSLFTDERVERMSTEGLICVPDAQKFGYQNQFKLPPKLVLKIYHFINDARKSFLDEMGWKENRTKDQVFISAKDGRPLKPNSVSAIFGTAMKKIGAPRRAGIHSMRHKFAKKEVGEETLARAALGLDTSARSVATAVALKTGHANPDSLVDYVNETQSELARQAIKRLGTKSEES